MIMNSRADRAEEGTWNSETMDLTPLEVREPVKDKDYDGVLWKIEGYNDPIPLRLDSKQRCMQILKSEGYDDVDPKVCIRRAFRNPVGAPET